MPHGDGQDCHILSAVDARGLLAGDDQLDAPVFVANGSNTACILEPGSQKRPVEQVLDWFVDSSEWFEGRHSRTKRPTLAEVRRRFAHNGAVKSPWNLPDMAYPFPEPGRPHFVSSRQCNFLHDVIRYILDVTPNNICQEDCPNRTQAGTCCSTQFLTMGEFGEIQQGWRHWQGTVMLAEAGALTGPHSDQWGMGTWISCLEGEFGFAWCRQPTDAIRDAILAGTDQPGGRWLYKVLRPDDSLYMPPGTPHAVFRLPRGKQTLGLAGHALRRPDLARWLHVLRVETEQALGDRSNRQPYPEVISGLVTGARHFFAQIRGDAAAEERYGGAESVGRAEKDLEGLEKLVNIE